MTTQIPFFWVLIAIVATVVFGSFVGRSIRYMDGRDRPIEGDLAYDRTARFEGMPEEAIRLDHPWMQQQLQGLLDHHGIKGSCNVRNGRVMRCEQPGDRAAFAAELSGAVNRAIDMAGGNPNLAIYTYREGRIIPVGQITLADLLGLAMMLETQP